MISKLRLLFDNFTIILTVVVLTATFYPAYGIGAEIFDWITNLAIALLFFFHGAKLSRTAIWAGIMHWRLHLLVFACTFILFPVVGWALKPILVPLLGMPLYIGMLYLCVLPGTVQSAIAFTSIARGNVPAAVCSASASSLIGIVLTPLLLKLLLDANAVGGNTLDAVIKISIQLLLPFVAGHLMRPLLGKWIDHNKKWLGYVDQTSILFVVYTAFSASVVGGLWQTVPINALLMLTAVCFVLLFIMLYATTQLARRLGFNRADEITIVFCGSKKSMATGVPMAQILFSGAAIGPALLPLIIFHQIQLMACAVLANRYALKDSSAKHGIEPAKA